MSGRQPIDIKSLKLLVFDEADELFLQDNNHPFFKKIFKTLREKAMEP
jgi:superfamily II DNA/RNA helicase